MDKLSRLVRQAWQMPPSARDTIRVMSVVGTRPEAVKLAPIVLEIEQTTGFESILCLTGQHADMVGSILELFGLVPQVDLQIMRSSQSLNHIVRAVLTGMEQVLAEFNPDAVLVQGDTTTAAATAIAAFHAHIPLCHVEAGLRTHDLTAPWPEEGNRQIISRLARLHFAPSIGARQNLLNEGVAADRIHVTGNTVIDSLCFVRDRILRHEATSIRSQFPWLDVRKRLILATGHRRENHNGRLARVCRALVRIAARGDCQVAFVKHNNPVVQATVDELLSGKEGVFVLEPQSYVRFVWLMTEAQFIITDSGGVQEEAPALGKPVLVTRETTERPEPVDAGTARLVGTDEAHIYDEAASMLDDPHELSRMSRAQSLYGDGEASRRIVLALKADLGLGRGLHGLDLGS
jgi:UDP-N-acetylglucosamine 2-epimerase (non-hydrolysing)